MVFDGRRFENEWNYDGNENESLKFCIFAKEH